MGQDVKIVREDSLVYSKAGDVELQLDLARPAEGDGPFPAVVCIHGGAWQAGKRQDCAFVAEALARNGFVAVTISYRFAPKYTFPAQIEDCKAAVRWLRANAARYKIDADRIGAIGFSAGAHLACLLGVTDPAAGLEGDGGNPSESTRLQAVVSVFGPTDFTVANWPADSMRVIEPLLGGTQAEKPDVYRRASPITWVTKDSPPFLFIHGDKDPIVRLDQSQMMQAKLQAAGVPAELIVLEGEGHGWGGEKMKTTLEQSVGFFGKHLAK
jgi:acetyl esterase/lipase